MKYHSGLDVSLKETFISIVDEKGKIVKEEAVASEGSAIAKFLLIPSLISNGTNEKELFLPIIGELSKFITCPICLPNNECWY